MGKVRTLAFKVGQVVRVRIPPYAKSWQTETSIVSGARGDIVYLETPLAGKTSYKKEEMQHVRYGGVRKTEEDKEQTKTAAESHKALPDVLIQRCNWVSKVIMWHEQARADEISAEIEELKAQDALKHKGGKCEICKRIGIAETYLAKGE